MALADGGPDGGGLDYDHAAKTLVLARVDYSIQLASVVVLYYDYAITLPFEIEFFWRNPWRLITFLYACCRYSLIANVLHLVLKTEGVRLSCNTVNLVTGLLSVLGHTGIVGVWGLRTYAICKRNKIVAAIVGTLGLAVVTMRIAIAGAGFAHIHTVAPNTLTCSTPPHLQSVSLSSAILMMLFEATSFVLATVRAWRTVKEDVGFWDRPGQSLNAVVFSQGLLYISAVLALSILSPAMNFKHWGGIIRPMNSMKLPLAGLLTARFLLKIKIWEKREVGLGRSTEDTDDYSGDKNSTALEFVTQGRASMAARTTLGAREKDEGEEGWPGHKRSSKWKGKQKANDSHAQDEEEDVDVIISRRWTRSTFTDSDEGGGTVGQFGRDIGYRPAPDPSRRSGNSGRWGKQKRGRSRDLKPLRTCASVSMDRAGGQSRVRSRDVERGALRTFS